MPVRTELADNLHRLSNLIERELSEFTRALLAESRHTAARDIIYAGCSFIECLRDVRDARDSKGGYE